ncbi:hypothetical protein BD779DRAFT_1607813 [Infundibulicybe gibba]|nr:hypothetical protein BD779DRAFT_1607813 [Infundibulicybe gibba]
MNHYTPSLSRTSSTTSVSSDDAAASSLSLTRRRRKRFTNVQLTMLEHLFHQNSHPSRLEREAVAQSGGMEIKSVTIWFKTNARQSAKSPSKTPAPYPHLAPTPTTSPSTRPSLDHVASRSELRAYVQRTPTRLPNPHASIWDNMPSSPPVPASPPPPSTSPPPATAAPSSGPVLPRAVRTRLSLLRVVVPAHTTSSIASTSITNPVGWRAQARTASQTLWGRLHHRGGARQRRQAALALCGLGRR